VATKGSAVLLHGQEVVAAEVGVALLVAVSMLAA
jgi:hypothetical protein